MRKALLDVLAGGPRVDPSVQEWVDGFFQRQPRLRKYVRGLNRIQKADHPGGGSHGEARQSRNDILLFPKFWSLPAKIQDFVFAHEIGHWVLTNEGGLSGLFKRAGDLGLDLWDPSNLPFGQFNAEEGFADAFASYFTDGDVKRRYPQWATLVESYL